MRRVVLTIVLILLLQGCYCKSCRGEDSCNDPAPIQVPGPYVVLQMAPCGFGPSLVPDYFEFSLRRSDNKERTFTLPSVESNGRVYANLFEACALSEGENRIIYRSNSFNPQIEPSLYDTIILNYIPEPTITPTPAPKETATPTRTRLSRYTVTGVDILDWPGVR